MRVPKQNRGPYILAAGAAAQLLTGIPAAWGVFQQPVMQGYGFSRGQAMLGFAVLVAAYGVGCAVGGLLQDAHGPRFAGLWGTALLAGGFFAAALVPPANASMACPRENPYPCMTGCWNTPHAAGMPVSSCAAAPAARMYGPRFCFGTGIPSPFRVSMPGLD